MTQNNEEALHKIMAQVQVYASSYSLVGTRFATDNQLEEADIEKLALYNMVKSALSQSPISQNEQHEVVAYADASLVCTISTYMIKELESRNETNKFPYHLWPTKLYTSPKQIPDGWISVDIRLPSAMQEVLLTNSDGYFVHGKPLFHNSTGEFNCWIYTLYSQDVLDFITQYRPTHWMPLPEAPTTSLTSETNTEVGE